MGMMHCAFLAELVGRRVRRSFVCGAGVRSVGSVLTTKAVAHDKGAILASVSRDAGRGGYRICWLSQGRLLRLLGSAA